MDSSGTTKMGLTDLSFLEISRGERRGALRLLSWDLESSLLGGLPLGMLCPKVTGLHWVVYSGTTWVSLLEAAQKDIRGLEVSTVSVKELEQGICFTIVRDYYSHTTQLQ